MKIPTGFGETQSESKMYVELQEDKKIQDILGE